MSSKTKPKYWLLFSTFLGMIIGVAIGFILIGKGPEPILFGLAGGIFGALFCVVMNVVSKR
jgi:uncharacterized membrane protein